MFVKVKFRTIDVWTIILAKLALNCGSQDGGFRIASVKMKSARRNFLPINVAFSMFPHLSSSDYSFWC